MRVYLSHPTGNQNSRQLAIALASKSYLQEFATALAIPPSMARSRLLPISVRAELERRSFPTPAQMRSLAVVSEVLRLAGSRFGSDTGRSAVDDLYRRVDRRAADRIRRCSPTHVYAYEDGALDSFRAAHAVGARTVYELPIGHWRAHRSLCEREQQLHPEWAHTWMLASEPEEKIARKDDELAAAQLVVVPSGFVKSTLLQAGIAASKITVVPYGCPPPRLPPPEGTGSGSPLRVIFVGGLSQRKGLSDLVEATAVFGVHVRVTVIGRGPAKDMLPANWTLIDSLAHAQVLEEMCRHDVFVFPTRFEGRSLAVAEAVACGLVVITTANSGAADLVEEGVNGWITEVGDVAAITAKLDLLLSQPSLLARMRAGSLRIAQDNGWQRFRDTITMCLSSMDKM